MRMNAVRLLLAVLCLSLFGCTRPQPLGNEELVEISAKAMAESGHSDQLISLSLDEVVLQALGQNLDFRISMLESAIASGNHKLANLELLPRLAASAGYSRRDNLLASVSKDAQSGQVSLVSSTGTDREIKSAALELDWNILDFSLAYFQAKEYADQSMAAIERRRRVMQNLMAEIVHVWWQVWSFQQLQSDLAVVREDVEQALSQSDRIISQRLVDPIRFIEYRKQLFYVLRRLDGLALQLDQAESRLVELLNLKPGTTLELRDGDALMVDAIAYGVPDVAVRHWQQAALMNRPEIRMAAYEGRAAISEAKRRLWGVFPRIGFRGGHNYSSNSYLENNSWAEGGVNVSVDLLRLTSIPSLKRNKNLVEKLVDAKQKAIGAAVVSQVAIADKAYRQNLRSWCMSDQLLSLDGQRAQLLEAKSSAAALDRLSLVQARTDHLLLRFEVAMAFADLQIDRMRLMLSTGLISYPPQTEQGIDPEAFPEWLYKGLYQNAGTEVSLAAEAMGEPLVPPEGAVKSELCK